MTSPRKSGLILITLVTPLIFCIVQCLDAVEKPKNGEETTRAPGDAILLRRGLLSILGLKDVPRIDQDIRIPKYMMDLYSNHINTKDQTTLHFKRLNTQDANTARSFLHVGSKKEKNLSNDAVDIYFNVTGWPANETVTSAELRLFRENDTSRLPSASSTYRINIYDVVRGTRGSEDAIMHLLDTRLGSLASGPWETLDITTAVQRGIRHPSGLLRLRVRATHLDGDLRGGVSHVRLRRSAEVTEQRWSDTRPLLVVYSHDRQHGERTKRSASGAPATRRSRSRSPEPATSAPAAKRKGGIKPDQHSCRRHKLWVEFADVGWKDWIVAPSGYDAYYCQGECPFPLADHLNTTNHAIVQTLVNSVNPEAVPRACCVPTELSPISMLYLDENQKVVLKNYQEMVVEGCGCR